MKKTVFCRDCRSVDWVKNVDGGGFWQCQKRLLRTIPSTATEPAHVVWRLMRDIEEFRPIGTKLNEKNDCKYYVCMPRPTWLESWKLVWEDRIILAAANEVLRAKQ